jgi:hypothetical protein
MASFTAMCYSVHRRIAMLDTFVYRFKNQICFYVVGTREAIQDLSAYVNAQQNTKHFSIMDFVKRIQFHNVYCCVIAETFPYRILELYLMIKLRIRKRLIDFDNYLEAFCIAHPEEACKTLPFPRDGLVSVVKGNHWFSIYESDEADVIQRILNAPEKDG